MTSPIRSSEPTQGVSPEEILGFLGDRERQHRFDSGISITGAAALHPGRDGCLSFAGDGAQDIAATRSSLVLIGTTNFHALLGEESLNLIAVDEPRREFARLVATFFGSRKSGGIAAQAVVDGSALIGPGTAVEPGAYIGPGVVLGADCYVGSNAVLLEGSSVGDHTTIGPNTTIGYVGFGYAREDDGTPVLIPHVGGVDIGSYVDIGSNVCIDRGTMSDTVIADHVKIDNLVHVAHNCQIEEGAFIIASAVLCGGVRVGPRAWIAPNSAVREQLAIGADATVGLSSTVIRDVPQGATVVGSPAKQVVR